MPERTKFEYLNYIKLILLLTLILFLDSRFQFRKLYIHNSIIMLEIWYIWACP